MREFKMYSKIQFYDSFREFMRENSLNGNDLILTNNAIYNRFVCPLPLSCRVLLTSAFGHGEPTVAMVDEIRAAMPDGIRRIIAVGGGTVMDIAKMLSLRVPSGRTEELFLGSETPVRICEVYAIPATCGTGSEVTNVCAAELPSLHTKRGLSNDLLFPAVSILIPELLTELPYRFFATSSIDALVHAAEAYLSPKATPHSQLFSREAIYLLLQGYRDVLSRGPQCWTELAADFLLAANYAGLAFSSAGCGAVHALSYPLGGKYHIPHGEANQVVFGSTFQKYKVLQPEGRIHELEEMIASCLEVSPEEALEALFALLDRIQTRKPLRAYGIGAEELPVFAKSVHENQQRLLLNNYVPLTVEDMNSIYSAVY